MVLVLGIFITLLSLPASASQSPYAFVAQQRFNSISGHVSDNRRNPIADLQVELLNDAESVIQRTKTDNAGFFVFNRLSDGIFQVRVRASGTSYIDQTQRVQLERSRAVEQLDFILASRTPPINTAGEVIFVQEVPDEARKLYEHAAASLEKPEREKDSVAALERAVQIFPGYFDALQLLGTEYVKQKEYERAVPLLTKAGEVNRQSAQTPYTLSVAQYNLKQLPEAIDSMRRALTLSQQSPTGNLWFGMLLRQASKFDEAETYLRKADQLAASKLADAHWQLALLYNQVKRYREAADELELFLKVQPDSKDTELIKKLIQRFRDQAK
jgi:Carboxypeptidase regulatory-like domain/Tetratricopeptide repeat